MAQFAEATATGNQVARVRLDGELQLQFQYLCFGQQSRCRFFKAGEADKFHSGKVRQWRTLSSNDTLGHMPVGSLRMQRRDTAIPPYSVARMSFRVLLGHRATEASFSSG